MMNIQPIKYFLYARKSSESEDRQMASIDDQVSVIKKLAQEKGIKIIEVFQESKSAKAPGRPVFNKMISKIEQGEADGIICWKLNRLARNPIDGGRISWLLQNNIIKHIQCNSSSYLPTDNVLMMAVELGMANQFIKDLSSDIKRGTRSKAERGWFPSPILPLGYIHNKSSKRKVETQEIIPDPIRFKIVKRLWKLMATGKYTITDIKKQGDLLGLENDKKKPYCLSTYFNLFTTPFYYGVFYWKNKFGVRVKIQGKHKKMIDEFTFNKVAKIIKEQSKKTRPKCYDFPFRGWLTCGECSSAITAERKVQVRCTYCRYKFSARHRDDCSKCFTKISDMKNPNRMDRTYYRCVKKKGPCSQKYITQEDLQKQFMEFLGSIQIPNSIGKFLSKLINESGDQRVQEKEEHISLLKKHKADLVSRQDGLLNMRADGDITTEIYQKKNGEIQRKIDDLDTEISLYSHRQKLVNNTLDSILKLGEKAQKIIQTGKINEVKDILIQFGSNQRLIDKKLCIIKPKHLSTFFSCVDRIKAKKGWLEPENPLILQGDLGGLETSSPILCKSLAEARASVSEYIDEIMMASSS